MAHSTHLFAGPTLALLQQQASPVMSVLAEMVQHPPAQLNSVEQLLHHEHSPGTLIIVDGLFGRHAAVSHQELMLAMQQGWQVWGLADIGAIRAYELRHQGMQGFGQVYEQLVQQPQLSDEQIVWHLDANANQTTQATSDETYTPLAIPKIHCYDWLRQQQADQQLTQTQYTALFQQITHTHYQDLTLVRLQDLVFAQGLTIPTAELQHQLRHSSIKVKDLDAFLRSPIWQTHCLTETRRSPHEML